MLRSKGWLPRGGLVVAAGVCAAFPDGAFAQAPTAIGDGLALKVVVKTYDTAHYNRVLRADSAVVMRPHMRLRLAGGEWQVDTVRRGVAGGAADLTLTFRLVSGHIGKASVGVAIEDGRWTRDHYVLMPGAVYAGNRFESRRLHYSPKLYEVQDIGPDKPIIISDVPRLAIDDGVSRIQERSGSMTTPAIGYFDPGRGRATWLITEQGNRLGDYGIGIEESRDRASATLSITAPLVREETQYRHMDASAPSLDTPHDFRPGERVAIRFRLARTVAPRLQTLFDQLAATATALSGTPSPAVAIPHSEAMRTLEAKFNAENFVPRYGYYAVGLRENYLQDWQIGWTGGMISTYPLLAAGSAETRARVVRNFDWLFPAGLSPSGFYWDAGRDGTIWYGGDIRKPHTANWHLIRKSGDALFYITRQFALMERLGIPVKPTWRDGNRGVADAFVRLWRSNHQLGQFVDSRDGRIIVGGSTSGAIVPAALVEAARYYHDPEYLRVAGEIGAYFAEQFLAKGITVGGPGDALQNPDSESAWGLVESYVALAVSTGDPKWRQLAGDAARQYASWVVSYDFRFPVGSAFAEAGIHTTGAVYANAQNTHAAPGICTASGLALLKLYRATGDAYYLDLLGPTARNITQYLPHPAKPLGHLPFGHVSERINMTDWEGPGTIGYELPLSTWAETSVMLTAVELPSVYVALDTGRVTSLDAIGARLIRRGRTTTFELVNHSPTAAVVTVMAEDAAMRQAPLSEGYTLALPRVALAPGERRVVGIGDDGKLASASA